jgi:DNA-directed RNA polymerase subunit RPC12/RpoP
MAVVDLFRKYWFVKVVLSLWLVSSIFILVLLSRIDSIVNDTLYTYNLTFNMNWYGPYRFALLLIYLFMAVPAVFSFIVLIAGFGKTDNDADHVRKRLNGKLSKEQAQIARENSMLIKCVKCGKVFNKPLTMLDFSSGKPRMANVCPYCNHVLENAVDKGPNGRIRTEFEEVHPEQNETLPT